MEAQQEYDALVEASGGYADMIREVKLEAAKQVAATTVQSAMRGRQVRRAKKRPALGSPTEDRAATTVQSMVRGRKARKTRPRPSTSPISAPSELPQLGGGASLRERYGGFLGPFQDVNF